MSAFHDEGPTLSTISKSEWQEYKDIISNQLFFCAQTGDLAKFKQLTQKYNITVFRRIKVPVRPKAELEGESAEAAHDEAQKMKPS